jgi:hypothetical protein
VKNLSMKKRKRKGKKKEFRLEALKCNSMARFL